MTVKTTILTSDGKSIKKTIPSHLVLMTIAKVTLPEPNRLEKAKIWLGSDSVFGIREKYLLEGLWKLLENEPHGYPITEISPKYVSYK